MDGHRHSLSERTWRIATYAVPLGFLALGFAYPLVSILERGLTSAPLDVLTDPLTRDVVWFTFWQALASTALTFALGLPAAYVLGRYAFPGRSLVRALVVVPFVLPTVVVALAFLAVLPAGLERGWVAILIAHAFFNIAVVVLIVGTFWAGLDRRVTEAAATLGAGPWRSFREVTLPLLAPALAAAGSIVFLFCFTSFGIVLILGGPAYSTIEAEIYNQAVRIFDLRVAAILSVIQLLCVGAAVWIALKLETGVAAARGARPEKDVLRRPGTRREWSVVVGSLAVLAAFLGVPLAVLVERSISFGDGYSLAAYRALSHPTTA
ncbi:MAG: ABC transporter permease, partial [Gaiellaceae bacterium]